MPALNKVAITLLAAVTGIDLNSGTAQALFTVPAGRTAIITHVVVRNASVSLTTASFSVGFNSASYNNILANATHTELTGNTLFTVLETKNGATIGAAGDILKLLANTLQGSAATVDIEVFGYLF